MIAQLNFGDTTISVFNLGNFAEDVGEWLKLEREIPKTLPILAFHIQTPTTSIVVDVPTNQSRPDMPTVNEPLFPPLARQMTAAGIDPNAVAHIVITHAHHDHCDGLLENGQVVFPEAMIWLHSADFHTPTFKNHTTFKQLHATGRLQLFSARHNISDRVTLLPTPGETPGHTAIRIACDEQTVYLVGDLWHDPLEFADVALSCFWADAVQNERSRRQLLAQMIDEKNVIWASHIGKSWRVTGSATSTGSGQAESPVWQPHPKN